MAQANLKAVITAEDKASSVIGGVGASFGKLTAAFAAGQLAAQAISKALQVVTDTVKESVGAAFNQVRQVENATFALKAYEKNGTAVNKVLNDLIAYARSDLGTLFQREDLFAAASTLKMYGQTTETLVDKVKILSKGVSLGKTSFQELSQIVGRAAAKGRLDAVDFDMLIERGIGIDRSFRGAAVTSENLFDALNKALPDELLVGRANTIDGAFIRLKTSMRDLGSAILGVDKNTSTFIEGGLGDRFMKAVIRFRELLANDRVKQTLVDIGSSLGRMADFVARVFMGLVALTKVYLDSVGPSLQQLWITIRDQLIPALQEWWRQVGPILGPQLVYLAKVVGVVLISGIIALTEAIRILVSVLAAFTDIQNRVISLFASVYQQTIVIGKAFWSLATSIAGAVSGVYDTITSPFRRAFDYIVGGVSRVRQELNNLSPIGGLGSIGRKLGIPGFAAGIRQFSGGMATVGENGPEKVILPKGSSVLPASQSGGGGQVNITVQAGAYMGNKQDARKYAEVILQAMKDTAKMNGTSITNMLGA